MGADYQGQEAAIAELSALSFEAKKYLNHHIGNSLQQVITGIETGNGKMAEDAAWHIVDDLHAAGIRNHRR